MGSGGGSCAVADGAVADGIVAGGAVAGGAVSGGAVASGTVAGGAVAGGAVAGGARASKPILRHHKVLQSRSVICINLYICSLVAYKLKDIRVICRSNTMPVGVIDCFFFN